METPKAQTETQFDKLAETIDVEFARLNIKIDRITESLTRLSTEMSTTMADVRNDDELTRWMVVDVSNDTRLTRWTIAAVVTVCFLGCMTGIYLMKSDLLTEFHSSLSAKSEQARPSNPHW